MILSICFPLIAWIYGFGEDHTYGLGPGVSVEYDNSREIVLGLLLSVVLASSVLADGAKSSFIQEEMKCRMLCQVLRLGAQCDHCVSRTPVRFGKRSGSELRLKLETRRSKCLNALSLLMRDKPADGIINFQFRY